MHVNLVRELHMREPLGRIKTLQQHAMGQLRLNALTMLSSEKGFIHGLPDLKRRKKKVIVQSFFL